MPRIVELITRRSERVAPSASLADVAALMLEAGISSVIVVEGEQAVGIVTEADMLRLARRHQSLAQPVGGVMTRPVHCVPAGLEYRAAFRDAAGRGLRHIVVEGEDGRPLGIVSEADFRRHLGAEFFHHMNSVDTLMDRQFPRLPPSATLDEALAAMEAVHGSCAVVVEGRQALGIVTERDAVRLFLDGRQNPPLAEVMTRPVFSVSADCLLAEAAQRMRERNIRHLVVVDAAGRLAGLLSEHALLRPLNIEAMDGALAERPGLTRARDLALRRTARDERYRQALLDNFPHLVWLKDTESRFLAVNRALADAAGAASPEQMIGRSDLDYWPPDLAERYRADDRAVMDGHRNRVVVEPLFLNKRLTWHETYKAPVTDADGTLLGTVGFAQDISARRRAEEAVLLRNAALAGLIRNEPLIGVLELIVLAVETEMPAWTCAIQLIDEDGRHLRPYAGPRLPETCAAGIAQLPLPPTADCLQSRGALDALTEPPQQPQQSYWAAYRQAARQAGFAAGWSEPILSPQGQLFGTFAAYCRQPDGGFEAQQALLTHAGQLTALILAHHRGADQLQKSLDTFRGIFDSISGALFIQAADGRFLDANLGAERLYGYPRHVLTSFGHAELGAPGHNDLAAVERHIQAAIAGRPQHFEYWAQDAHGRSFPVEVRLQPCDYFGQAVLVASVVDIGQRKRAELRLEIEHDLAQALAAGLPRDAMLDTILRAALRLPDLDAGCIYARTDGGGYRLTAHHGLSPAFLAEYGELAADSAAARSIAAGQVVCSCADYAEHCHDSGLLTAPAMRTESLHCLTVLPVLVGGVAIACLYLGGHRSRRISADTLHALETLSGHFAQTLLRFDAQEEAARLQHNLGGLFDTLPDFILVIDTDGRLLHCNQAVAELGHDPAALRGRPLAAVHPPALGEAVAGQLAEMLDGRRTTSSLPLQHADGSAVAVDSRIITGYWDGRPAIFAVARDIRERLIAEERQKLAASVFDHAHEGIMITDRAGRIVEVNGTFSELTGYPRAEAVGQTADLLKSGHHDADFYRQMWCEIRDRGYWRGEVWNRKKSGEIFVELLTISTVRDRQGEISHFVGIFSDITLIKEHQQRLEHLAHFDALTQLPNRMLLRDRMQLAMAQTERSGRMLAVCYLDLDGFKPVNDRYGHAVGDKLLIDVAQRLKACIRAGDTASRLGGDEFVLLFSGLDDIHECDRAIGRVIAQLGAPFRIAGHDISISASIGVTLYPQDGSDSDTLLRHADQAMYAAKQAGRNRFHLFDPENDRRARLRREEIGRIRQALAEREFVLFYQPKVDMRRGRVVGAEALIRWRHPERGLLLPADFLPAVEGSELAVALGDWVLQEALGQLAQWHAQGLDLTVSVNIAGNHLQAAGFAARLGELLAAHPEVPPASLELEVLETTALEDIANVAALFAECRRYGVRFSLDDFGTGYSSLTYFRRLPADVLKIDQSFVRNMLDDPDDLSIVEGVIGLTRAFQRKVIAEGVETVEHGMVLLQLGCDMAQGYGIAHPMPAADLPGWTRDFQPDPMWNSIATFRWPREELPMLIAELEHQRWQQQLLAGLDAPDPAPPPPLLDPRHCRFGRWYHGPQAGRYRHLAAFADIDAAHVRLHELGRQLVALRDAGRPTAGHPLRDELAAAGETISQLVRQVQAEILLAEPACRR